jgi:hypothetical protein
MKKFSRRIKKIDFYACFKKKVFYLINSNVLLALLTLLAVALIYQASFLYGRYVSKEVFCLNKINNKCFQIAKNTTIKNKPVINSEIYSRLKEQFDYANDKKQFHLHVANYFNIHYYAMTFTLTICCIFTGLMIFLITKEGWDKANKHVLTMFLVFLATSIYFGTCPSVFKVDDNITQNEACFNSYCNIANKIQSFIVTSDTLKGSPSDTLKREHTINYDAITLIKENDQDFNNLNRISIGIDITKVKSASDVLKTFNETTTNNTTPIKEQ